METQRQVCLVHNVEYGRQQKRYSKCREEFEGVVGCRATSSRHSVLNVAVTHAHGCIRQNAVRMRDRSPILGAVLPHRAAANLVAPPTRALCRQNGTMHLLGEAFRE
ncbi:hypothetical protein J6590_054447 [Homalodisca vitripennis]|nr:hypothetical protein J6590_054447 [Homalodisca vitripennis]